MQPNIVIIIFDALRAYNLHVYGYRRNTIPFLFENKHEFAICQNAISSTCWMMPSVASLFTVMYASGFALVTDRDKLDERLPWLTTILKNRGYRSATFVRNVYLSEHSRLIKSIPAKAGKFLGRLKVGHFG